MAQAADSRKAIELEELSTVIEKLKEIANEIRSTDRNLALKFTGNLWSVEDALEKFRADEYSEYYSYPIITSISQLAIEDEESANIEEDVEENQGSRTMGGTVNALFPPPPIPFHRSIDSGVVQTHRVPTGGTGITSAYIQLPPDNRSLNILRQQATEAADIREPNEVKEPETTEEKIEVNDEKKEEEKNEEISLSYEERRRLRMKEDERRLITDRPTLLISLPKITLFARAGTKLGPFFKGDETIPNIRIPRFTGSVTVSHWICMVCRDESKEHLAVTVCGHLYHQQCLEQWFLKGAERGNKCPVCDNPTELGTLFFGDNGERRILLENIRDSRPNRTGSRSNRGSPTRSRPTVNTSTDVDSMRGNSSLVRQQQRMLELYNRNRSNQRNDEQSTSTSTSTSASISTSPQHRRRLGSSSANTSPNRRNTPASITIPRQEDANREINRGRRSPPTSTSLSPLTSRTLGSRSNNNRSNRNDEDDFAEPEIVEPEALMAARGGYPSRTPLSAKQEAQIAGFGRPIYHIVKQLDGSHWKLIVGACYNPKRRKNCYREFYIMPSGRYIGRSGVGGVIHRGLRLFQVATGGRRHSELLSDETEYVKTEEWLFPDDWPTVNKEWRRFEEGGYNHYELYMNYVANASEYSKQVYNGPYKIKRAANIHWMRKIRLDRGIWNQNIVDPTIPLDPLEQVRIEQLMKAKATEYEKRAKELKERRRQTRLLEEKKEEHKNRDNTQNDEQGLMSPRLNAEDKPREHSRRERSNSLNDIDYPQSGTTHQGVTSINYGDYTYSDEESSDERPMVLRSDSSNLRIINNTNRNSNRNNLATTEEKKVVEEQEEDNELETIRNDDNTTLTEEGEDEDDMICIE